MSLNSLQDLMVHNLKDLYNAERQILGALPRMAKAAQTPALKEALENHRRQTETHLARLEEVFGLLDLPARGKSCKAMEGLIAEGKEVSFVFKIPSRRCSIATYSSPNSFNVPWAFCKTSPAAREKYCSPPLTFTNPLTTAVIAFPTA
jgi:hypothetical protein